MARRIYSTSLIQAQGLVGSRDYTVQPGFLLVVRDVSAYNGGGVVSTNLFVKVAGAQTFVYFQTVPGGGGAAFHWDGRVVLGPGQTLEANTNGAWDVTVSGYLLTA